MDKPLTDEEAAKIVNLMRKLGVGHYPVLVKVLMRQLAELESAVAVAAVCGWDLDTLKTLRRLAGVPLEEIE